MKLTYTKHEVSKAFNSTVDTAWVMIYRRKVHMLASNTMPHTLIQLYSAKSQANTYVFDTD